MAFLSRYSALLAKRDLRLSIGASILGRLPIGITGLAILMLIQGATGSFAEAGAATACYVVGLAAAAPPLGRLIDRRGPHRLLWCCGVLFPAALLGVVAAVQHYRPVLALLLAGLAGASLPPITVCTYLRRVLADEGALAAAYSLESVLIELIFIIGPLLVAFFVAFASAAMAVVFSAACGLAGTALFLRSPVLRQWRIEPRSAPSLLGPLDDRRFIALLFVVLCYCAAFGLVEVGLTGYATEVGHPALAGLLLGLMSAGSALGGLAYGSRTWHAPLVRQFAFALALMGLGLAVLALPWRLAPFALWCAFASIVMAPALIMQAMLVASIARADQLSEAFTWPASALLAGVGIGVAMGGSLMDNYRSPGTLAAASAVALLAAAAASFLNKS